MGTITVESIIREVREDTHDDDPDEYRVKDKTSLRRIIEAQQVIVSLQPKANPVTEVLELAAGTKQSIPEGGIALIDVVRNMGADGETPGRVISIVEQDELDSADPDWHAADPSAAIEQFVFNDKNPLVFYTTPPSGGNNYVEMVYSKTPTAPEKITDTITIEDAYAPAIKVYLKYKASSPDAADSLYATQNAAAYWQLFLTLIDRPDLAKKAYSPKVRDYRSKS